MSNNEFKDNEEDQLDQSVPETSSAPSGITLFADRIKRWLNSQNKTLTYGVVALFVIIAGILCYMQFYKIPREKEAIASIYQVQDLFDVDSFRQVAKEAPKLADRFSGTKGGELAAYMAGASFLYTGDFKNAVKYLKEVDFKDQVMKAQATGLLGDAYVETKDLESGLSQYLKASKNAKTDFAAIWWGIKAGRIYEKKNEWKKALELYTGLIKDHNNNETAQEIKDVEKLQERAKAKTGDY